MRKLIICTMAALAMLALTAMPAAAADLPYGDDDPANWKEVAVGGPCSATDCSFSGVSDDTVVTWNTSSGSTAVVPCDPVTFDYEIELIGGAWFSDFEIVDSTGGSCITRNGANASLQYARTQHLCVYSPSGFESGLSSEDGEYWIRDGFDGLDAFYNNAASYQPAFARLNGSGGPGYLDTSSFSYDGQVIYEHPGPGVQRITIDGTIDLDSVLTVNATEGYDGRCMFPELAS